MPSHWKAMPPSTGPIARVAAEVTLSSAMAVTMRCGPATSPTMRRRVDISVDHMVPESRLASATCQTSRCPVTASVACSVEISAGTTSASMKISLRFIASESAPAKAPNSSCGSWRSATTTVTAKAECVASQANRPEASSSSQRIALAKAPTSHSLRKSGERRSSRIDESIAASLPKRAALRPCGVRADPAIFRSVSARGLLAARSGANGAADGLGCGAVVLRSTKQKKRRNTHEET